jgi:hypothetical protein
MICTRLRFLNSILLFNISSTFSAFPRIFCPPSKMPSLVFITLEMYVESGAFQNNESFRCHTADDDPPPHAICMHVPEEYGEGPV